MPPRKRKPKRKIFALHPEPPPTGLSGFLKGYLRELQRYFTTGLLVWIPLIVTLWVCWWVFELVGGTIDAVFTLLFRLLRTLGARTHTLRFLTELDYSFAPALLVTLLVFLATGLFARYVIARKLISSGEQVLAKIPLISKVYHAVKQIRDVFINREGTVFQEVVLVAYPRPGIYAVGFITSEAEGVVQQALGKALTAVFIPTTPNPTSGFLLYVPEEEMIAVDLSVEDAMKLIVSGGAYHPSGRLPQELEASDTADGEAPDRNPQTPAKHPVRDEP
jgi:uncharacterized membrane protein